MTLDILSTTEYLERINMKWLLIAIIYSGGGGVATVKSNFENKKECVYVGTWIKNNGGLGKRIEAKCFEVNDVRFNK